MICTHTHTHATVCEYSIGADNVFGFCCLFCRVKARAIFFCRFSTLLLNLRFRRVPGDIPGGQRERTDAILSPAWFDCTGPLTFMANLIVLEANTVKIRYLMQCFGHGPKKSCSGGRDIGLSFRALPLPLRFVRRPDVSSQFLVTAIAPRVKHFFSALLLRMYVSPLSS